MYTRIGTFFNFRVKCVTGERRLTSESIKGLYYSPSVETFRESVSEFT